MRAPLLLLALLLALPAGAAPRGRGRVLELEAAPAALLQQLHQEPELARLRLLALEVLEEDLDGDGRPEWIVAAICEDEAGLRPVNRPFWLFAREGEGFRKLHALGAHAEVRAQPPRPGQRRRELHVLTRDGPSLRCNVLGFQDGAYRLAGACGKAQREK